MVELANKIAEMIQSGNILWLAVIAAVALAMKTSKIVEFFESRKKAQISKLIEASNCDLLDKSFKEFLSHEIQRQYFLYIAKISAEKPYRDKLFHVYKNANGNLPFFHFRRASSYLRYKDEVLSVEISMLDNIFSFINSVVAIFFGFIGLAMFMMPSFIKPIFVIQTLTLYGMSAFFVGMAMFFSTQSFPLRSAKIIRTELNKSHNNLIQPIAIASAD
ncbi:MAG: hypothetical protein WCY67_10370 [Acidithiobacillus sp.]